MRAPAGIKRNEVIRARRHLLQDVPRDALVVADEARDLRVVDAELNDLAPARDQHHMLRDACSKLDELSASGAASLFWGADVHAGAERVKLARSRVEDFQRYLDAIEDRRVAIVDRLMRQQQDADLAEVITRLTQLQQQLQASLQSGLTNMQLNLLDFLR